MLMPTSLVVGMAIGEWVAKEWDGWMDGWTYTWVYTHDRDLSFADGHSSGCRGKETRTTNNEGIDNG